MRFQKIKKFIILLLTLALFVLPNTALAQGGTHTVVAETP
jgi:hypothetical protein